MTRHESLLEALRVFLLFQLAMGGLVFVGATLVSGWHLFAGSLDVDWPFGLEMTSWEFDGINVLDPGLGQGWFLVIVMPRLAQAAVALWGGWHMHRLVQGYRKGSIFTQAAVSQLSRIGGACLVVGLIPATQLVTQGDTVQVTFELNWPVVFLGQFLYVMAAVHGEGLRLQRDHELVI